ncbi:hypothetical protein CRG98_037633 [Punica granatum]|uniref:Uncharacterized protein n=1 Tax=Punica granatum TaxID=22663 RepID=A0A2I0IDU7_PUNGR|nr:hypothetical protein CRG98_037633 [Punica granatum]
MSSAPGFSRESSRGKPVGQNGVLTPAPQVRRATSLVPLVTLPGRITPQVRRANSLVPLATLPGLITRASLLFCIASSRSHLALLLKLCCVFEPVRAYFPAPQVRRANSLVPLATLPGLITRASLLFCIASSRSHLALLLKLCCVFEPVRAYFPAPQVRRATSLVLLLTLPGLLTRASLLSCTLSLSSLLACVSCNLAGSANPSPSQLARASCNLAGSANPCEITFLQRKFAEPNRSCLLQPCRVCYPVRDYFPTTQVRRAKSLVPLATLPGLLSRARLLSYNASSPSQIARASCNLAGSAIPCEITFLQRKFAEPNRSCLLQPCRVCYPVRDYFPTTQVRRAKSLVPLATLPGLLSRARLLSYNASSPSQIARASCNLAGSAIPCEITFLQRKFAEPNRSCLLQPCRVCYPVRDYFPTTQVRRAKSLVPLATLPGLLSRARLLSYNASSPSQIARASCNLAGSAIPCEITFLQRKFAEPNRSCLLQPCRVCYPVRDYFPTTQVRRAKSLVPLATLPGLLSRARLLSYNASSPSQIARASCNLAGSAIPCEITFLQRKFAEPNRSCLLQPCRVCYPVRDYFPTTQVRRAKSLVPLATLPGLLSRARLLSYNASSPSQIARASCNLAGSAIPCEITFLQRKFAEPNRSCLLQPCRVCYPVRDYFPTTQVRRAKSLVPLATLPGLLSRARLLSYNASSPSQIARASCNLAGSAIPCEITFLQRKFAEPNRSCLLQPCRVCYPVRDYFPTTQVRRAKSLVPLATLPGLLSRARLLSYNASSPSQIARASCNLAGSAIPCEITFLQRKFAEPNRSCLLQPCRVCYPVRDYFPTTQVRRAKSLVPLATLPGLLTRVSLLSCTTSSPSHLARASCNLAGSANPCEFTFLQRNFAEPPPSCLMQPCRIC